MHQLFRSVGISVGVVLGLARVMNAQEIASGPNERAPRFLLAMATKVVPVDVQKTPVLTRRLHLELEGATLKQALAEIAAQSGLVLAYSDDALPLEKHVHLRAEAITVAAALTDVLLGAGVDVVFSRSGGASLLKRSARAETQPGNIVGQVTDSATTRGLAGVEVRLVGTRWQAVTGEDGRYTLHDVEPGSYTIMARRIGYRVMTRPLTVAGGQEVAADFALTAAATKLDELVVTGTVAPTRVRELSHAMSVINGGQIDSLRLQSVDQIFRVLVPGGVQSTESPGGGGYTAFSLRGTSTLSGAASNVKTFIDGIEVTDAAYINLLDPSVIERVEVLPGPQAAALYGTGALGGVMQIFTKHGVSGSAPMFTARAEVGAIDQRYNSAGLPVRARQDLSVTGSGRGFGYNLGGSLNQTGAYTVGHRYHEGNLFGGGDVYVGPAIVGLTVRYGKDHSRGGLDPESALQGSPDTLLSPPNSSDWWTVAGNTELRATDRWRHHLTIGQDRSAYDESTPDEPDAALYHQNVHTTSMSYNTTWNAPVGLNQSLALTAGVNHRRYVFQDTANAAYGGVDTATTSKSHDTGFFGQVVAGWHDVWFLTLGIDGYRSPELGDSVGTAWSPHVGLTRVLDFRGGSVKLRGSYGSALRAPDIAQKAGSVIDYGDGLLYVHVANPDLRPERQRGFEGGIDFSLGNRLDAGLTYYNQLAVDLIGNVDLPPEPSYPDAYSTFQFQNLGRIRNKGIELSLQFVPISTLTLTGVLGTTTSRVKSLDSLYTGTLKPGDELRSIPDYTAGATIAWSPWRGGSVTGSVAHRGRWVELDFNGLLRDFNEGTFTGDLNDYFITYPKFTKVNLGVSQDISPLLTGYVQLDNLFNSYRYERSNGIAQMGRVITVGARTRIPLGWQASARDTLNER